MSGLNRPVTYPDGTTLIADFSEDECERRMNEMLRRGYGYKAAFDLDTGQPFQGPQLSDQELQRRGYK